MRERAIRIGKPTPLAAIVAEPDSVDASKPAVIILNSGVMHHVGTCRMSVHIARALADAGIVSVRFDFSGIGDSETRRGSKPFEQTAIEETAEVMDYLQRKRGIQQFVLYGLCSGADGSYEVAKVDQRVIGIAQIDPFCYRTRRWYLHHYGPRLLQPEVWKRLVGKLLGKGQTRAGGDDPDDEFVEMPSYVREFPPREEVKKGLAGMVDRGVAVYSIFTGGQRKILNHPGQFESSFSDLNFKGLLTVDYHLDATHIITGKTHQQEIPKDIARWVLSLARDTETDLRKSA